MKLVNVKVRAIEIGYFGNKIIQPGEVFTYTGGLNSKGQLPRWVEAVDKVEAPVAPKAPAKKPAPKKEDNSKQSLVDSIA